MNVGPRSWPERLLRGAVFGSRVAFWPVFLTGFVLGLSVSIVVLSWRLVA